jgi:hypothetical protein
MLMHSLFLLLLAYSSGIIKDVYTLPANTAIERTTPENTQLVNHVQLLDADNTIGSQEESTLPTDDYDTKAFEPHYINIQGPSIMIVTNKRPSKYIEFNIRG